MRSESDDLDADLVGTWSLAASATVVFFSPFDSERIRGHIL